MKIFNFSLVSRTILTQSILLSYFTENRKSRVTELKSTPACGEESHSLGGWKATMFTDAEDTFLFIASVWQQLRVTSESYIRQGPWIGLYVLCVNMLFGSHTVLYTRRQHTSGRRHISAPYYDTLWHSMLNSAFQQSFFLNHFLRRKNYFHRKKTTTYRTINICGMKIHKN